MSVPNANLENSMVPLEQIMEPYQMSSQEMWLGRKFPNRDTFRKTLAKFAIYNNFTLKHLKTNRTKVTNLCNDNNCLWRIHAYMVEFGPQFQVRMYYLTHSCSKPMMGMTYRQASAELIAEFILDRVQFNNKLTPKIINEYQTEFRCPTTYRRAHKAKDIAHCAIQGSYEESFRILPLYCIELKKTNPGTITNIKMADGNTF
eukprot:TRINITY_DN29288_c0_g1_i1.p1 TRINITY_DN29288_c0_g1~~TRINITY_DN29288_c0_g1_i1.p1  ORF type:complete len:202 (-),score=10.97 TRINITY_DN29288_c0_g1_i1:620-1225(-)